jgi:hypothetical protein
MNICWSENQNRETEVKKMLKIALEENGGFIPKKNTTESAESCTKFPAPVLSKFEKDAFERAKDRQVNRLRNGTEQVASGRTYKGAAYVAKPSEITFKDFEIGKKYKKIFLFTNTSYTFNSFKFLDFPDEHADFFTVSYERMGRMSAGVSANIEIIFTPKINEDIYTGASSFFSLDYSFYLFLILR